MRNAIDVVASTSLRRGVVASWTRDFHKKERIDDDDDDDGDGYDDDDADGGGGGVRTFLNVVQFLGHPASCLDWYCDFVFAVAFFDDLYLKGKMTLIIMMT